MDKNVKKLTCSKHHEQDFVEAEKYTWVCPLCAERDYLLYGHSTIEKIITRTYRVYYCFNNYGENMSGTPVESIKDLPKNDPVGISRIVFNPPKEKVSIFAQLDNSAAMYIKKKKGWVLECCPITISIPDWFRKAVARKLIIIKNKDLKKEMESYYL
jgi:hypothetical protein